MRKLIVILFIPLFGCATLLTGPTTEYQRTKPKEGEPARELRGGFIFLDIITVVGIPGLLIDFATKKIYKPYPSTNDPGRSEAE